MAKKMDRFGWERDRNSQVHDRLVMDWMDALQDYPLDEIRAACRDALYSKPNSMPHEGHILAQILKVRSTFARLNRPPEPPEPERGPRMTADQVNKIMLDAGFAPRKIT